MASLWIAGMQCIATTEAHGAWRLRGLRAASPALALFSVQSLHGAIKQHNRTFISDSDLSPSLLTSKLVLGCACTRGLALWSVCFSFTFTLLCLCTSRSANKNKERGKLDILWSVDFSISFFRHPPHLSCLPLLRTHASKRTRTHAHARTCTCLCFCNSHRKQKQQDGLFLQMEAKQ